MRLAFVIVLLALPAAAAADEDERSAFYGTWGKAHQCARAPIKEGGTVLAEPFEIGDDWLRHGQVWCRLSWFPIERRVDGLFSGARAQCGEDAVRDYTLRMDISGEELTLRWGIFRANGPLVRCPNS